MGVALVIAAMIVAVGVVTLLAALRSHRELPPLPFDDGDGPEDGGGGGGGGIRRDPPRPSPGGGPDPDWWPDFEREFAAYVGRSRPVVGPRGAIRPRRPRGGGPARFRGAGRPGSG